MPRQRHTSDLWIEAMGTGCRILVDGPDPAAVDAAAGFAANRIHGLEARWSRFIPTSEVSWLNGHAGLPARVSDETLLLVARAVVANEMTAGRFEALLLPQLAALGYDRSHEQLGDTLAPSAEVPPPTATSARIDVDPWLSTVTLPAGTAFDPGGLGKGAAADLVAEALEDRDDLELHTVLVSLGGDLRVGGPSVAAHGWQLDIEHPGRPGVPVATVPIGPTAAATSSTLRRRWRSAAGAEVHHLLDPRSGRPAHTDLAAATVLAPEAWVAEALAKAAVIAGCGAATDLLTDNGARGVLFGTDGRCRPVGIDRHEIRWKESDRWS